jgi:hypothetical protein
LGPASRLLAGFKAVRKKYNFGEIHIEITCKSHKFLYNFFAKSQMTPTVSGSNISNFLEKSTYFYRAIVRDTDKRESSVLFFVYFYLQSLEDKIIGKS